jgi:RNA polymerase sigma factor (TIGR02999 family)
MSVRKYPSTGTGKSGTFGGNAVVAGFDTSLPGESPAQKGEKAEALVAQVYQELRRLAHHLLSPEPAGQVMQSTALVHEAYLRLVGSGSSAWSNKGHFFGAAAQAMRRILVEQARQRHSAKHGGGRIRVTFNEAAVLAPEPSEDILALDEALTRLEQRDPRKGRIVMLRYFAGLSVHETAEVLEVSATTVKADWSWAKAWLHREITREDRETGDRGHDTN